MSDSDDVECLDSPVKTSVVRKKPAYVDADDEQSSSESELDKSDNQNNEMPSGPECLQRCKQFAEITGTDSALAMFYLQDNNWNLEKSLDIYFKQTSQSSSKVVACFDVEELNQDELKGDSKKRQNLNKEDGPSKKTATTSEASTSNEETDENLFKLLSWNIDGLDRETNNLGHRTRGVVSKITTEKPDLVFLQEVIRESETILRGSLAKLYEFSTGYSGCEYYTLILAKKSTCQVKSNDLIEFSNTSMGRNLLQVKLRYKNQVNICAMTSHLESTADFSKQRTQQLKQCLEEMSKVEPDCVVFFGGDLNLRDSELQSIGGLPGRICDVWQATGSRKECLYTWDMMRNTNLTMNGKFKPRCRFDRLYYRPKSSDESQTFTLMPVYFELEGLERLKTCNRFCSDHWAIQAYCQLQEC